MCILLFMLSYIKIVQLEDIQFYIHACNVLQDKLNIIIKIEYRQQLLPCI